MNGSQCNTRGGSVLLLGSNWRNRLIGIETKQILTASKTTARTGEEYGSGSDDLILVSKSAPGRLTSRMSRTITEEHRS